MGTTAYAKQSKCRTRYASFKPEGDTAQALATVRPLPHHSTMAAELEFMALYGEVAKLLANSSAHTGP